MEAWLVPYMEMNYNGSLAGALYGNEL